MRIAIVHGYFLSDSGSAIYVRELAREFVRQGHDVTLVCQEQHPGHFDFINSVYELDEGNLELRLLSGEEGSHAGGTGINGSCRLIRPHIGGRMLTYVTGPFPGFEAHPLQDAGDREIAAYAEANIMALATVFKRWPPQIVQANHLVMQPYFVRRAMEAAATGEGRLAPYIVTIHGSALNFTVKADERMSAYAVDGLEGATAVVSLSESSRTGINDFAEGQDFDINSKSHIVPPGVDTGLFKPSMPKPSGLLKQGATLVFVGRLLWTKGLQYAVAALPLIIAGYPDVRLLVAGDGPMREPLEKLITLLDSGDLDGAARLLSESHELQGIEEFGSVMPDLAGSDREAYRKAAYGGMDGRIQFLGHRPHHELAPLYAMADLALSPSIFPEAFALVSIEAMAGGAIPLATYQTGLTDPLDAAGNLLGDPAIASMKPGCHLTEELAAVALHLLARFPTDERAFRQRLHGVVEELYSWEVVASRYLDLEFSSD